MSAVSWRHVTSVATHVTSMHAHSGAYSAPSRARHHDASMKQPYESAESPPPPASIGTPVAATTAHAAVG